MASSSSLRGVAVVVVLGDVLGVALLVALGVVGVALWLCAPAGNAKDSIAAPASATTSDERVQNSVAFMLTSSCERCANRSRQGRQSSRVPRCDAGDGVHLREARRRIADNPAWSPG